LMSLYLADSRAWRSSTANNDHVSKCLTGCDRMKRVIR
jgi:hypothetical protein